MYVCKHDIIWRYYNCKYFFIQIIWLIWFLCSSGQSIRQHRWQPPGSSRGAGDGRDADKDVTAVAVVADVHVVRRSSQARQYLLPPGHVDHPRPVARSSARPAPSDATARVLDSGRVDVGADLGRVHALTDGHHGRAQRAQFSHAADVLTPIFGQLYQLSLGHASAPQHTPRHAAAAATATAAPPPVPAPTAPAPCAAATAAASATTTATWDGLRPAGAWGVRWALQAATD